MAHHAKATALYLAVIAAAACLFASLDASAAPGATVAADDAEPSWHHDVELTLRPAAAPSPALRYRLLPPAIDRRPGNAAEFYLEAAALLEEIDRATQRAINRVFDMPIEQLRADTPHGIIEPFEPALQKVAEGARRDHCIWELPTRSDGIHVEKPELRHISKIRVALQLRSRLALVEGRFDDAWHDYQTLMALSRHMTQGRSTSRAFPALGGVSAVLRQIEDAIQQPQAPNLYWALSTLPESLLDARTAFEFEEGRLWWELAGPQRGDALLRDELDVEGFIRFITAPGGLRDDDADVPLRDVERTMALTFLTIKYPRARQWLIAQGVDEADIDAMAVHRVVMRYYVEGHTAADHSLLKWGLLPRGEAADHLHSGMIQEVEGRLHREDPLMLFPHAGRIRFGYRRASDMISRRIAMLRIIEAIRMYIAEHGTAPDTLADITAVPVPADPSTGEPFRYERNGNTVIIASAPDGEDAPYIPGFRFTLHFEN